MNVLVFGTGGVGGIYAYILEQGGAQITVVCRSNYEAVLAYGIEIDSAIFGKVHIRPKAVVQSAADAQGPFDYIVVAAKAFPGLSKLITPAVSPTRTAIVLAQNGIGVEQEYLDAYPDNVIISGVVYLPTTQVTPGKIRMGNLQRLHVGTYPAENTAAAKQAVVVFAETFTKGGGVIFTHDDVQYQRWIKLSVNVAWNPICALSRCDDANFLRSSPDAEVAIRAVMAEVTTVAAASGYPIAQEVIDEQLQRAHLRLESGGKEPSMLTDVRENRALEVNAILGNAVAAARRVGVDTPRLDLIYALARALSYSIKPDEKWKPIA